MPLGSPKGERHGWQLTTAFYLQSGLPCAHSFGLSAHLHHTKKHASLNRGNNEKHNNKDLPRKELMTNKGFTLNEKRAHF